MTLYQTAEQYRAADVAFGYATSVGKVRETNQDNAAVVTLPGTPMGHCVLAIVADGMGGHQGGEVASSICVSSILEFFELNCKSITTWNAARAIIQEALGLAHSRIRKHAVEQSSNLGTTATVALYCNGEVEIAHIGDSRAYLISSGELCQLTEDDSWVAEQVRQGVMTEAEAAVSANRNVLTQALSISPDVSIHSYHERVPEHVCLLLCSDGLHGVVRPAALKQIVTGASSPKAAAEKLVYSANSLGGPDNITVVCLWTGDGPRSKSPTLPVYISRAKSRLQSKRMLGATAVFVVVLGIVLLGWNYLKQPDYVIPSDKALLQCTVKLNGREVQVECDKDIDCVVYFKRSKDNKKLESNSKLLGDRVHYLFKTQTSIFTYKPVSINITLSSVVGSKHFAEYDMTTKQSSDGYSATVENIRGALKARIKFTWPNRSGTTIPDTATVHPNSSHVGSKSDVAKSARSTESVKPTRPGRQTAKSNSKNTKAHSHKKKVASHEPDKSYPAIGSADKDQKSQAQQPPSQATNNNAKTKTEASNEASTSASNGNVQNSTNTSKDAESNNKPQESKEKPKSSSIDENKPDLKEPAFGASN